jgi:tRNA(fMet)-specific endonuclease VapC
MYLLDTNHCSRIIFGDARLVDQLAEKARTNTPVYTCAIVRGELVFMAEKSEQRESNLAEVESFFEDISIYPIDQDTATVYGQLKAAIINHFGPKEKSKRRRVRVEELGIHENDLWIAAVALQYALVVVSEDSDFQRIKELSALQLESWLS